MEEEFLPNSQDRSTNEINLDLSLPETRAVLERVYSKYPEVTFMAMRSIYISKLPTEFQTLISQDEELKRVWDAVEIFVRRHIISICEWCDETIPGLEELLRTLDDYPRPQDFFEDVEVPYINGYLRDHPMSLTDFIASVEAHRNSDPDAIEYSNEDIIRHKRMEAQIVMENNENERLANERANKILKQLKEGKAE